MTTARIGLMGFGRIGRNVFRLLHNRADLDIVAIADVAKPEALTYLLKYDSIYGRFPLEVEYRDGQLLYGDKTVAFQNSRIPAETKWADAEVDIVVDTTSRYRSLQTLQGHLDNGAGHVVLTSSPETPGEIPLLLKGINDKVLDTGHRSSHSAPTPRMRWHPSSASSTRLSVSIVSSRPWSRRCRTPDGSPMSPPTPSAPAGPPGRTSSRPKPTPPRSSPRSCPSCVGISVVAAQRAGAGRIHGRHGRRDIERSVTAAEVNAAVRTQVAGRYPQRHRVHSPTRSSPRT